MKTLIAKSAVREFLARDLDDFRWLKREPRKVLERELRAIAPQFKPKTKPWDSQVVCTFIGACMPQFLFFLDMSAGKTKTGLDIFTLRKSLGEVEKMLVVTDNIVNIYTWQEEIELHTDLKCCALDSTSQGRMNMLETVDADIYVINYLGLVHLLCKKDSGEGKLKPNYYQADKLAKKFGMLWLDEIHMCKNKDSLSHRVINRLCRRITYRYGATGTSMGKGPADLWAQFYLIDRGAALGETVGMFRAAFFKEVEAWGGRTAWEFDERKLEALTRTKQHRSITYTEEELGDLPRKLEKDVVVPMSSAVENYYAMVKKGMVEFYRSGGKAAKAEIKNSYIKLRQVLSGFLALDADGVKVEAEFGCNKTQWLEDTIEDIVSTEGKTIIFHDFICTGKRIEALLRKKKIKHLSLRGGAKKGDVSKRFKNDLSYKVLVSNLKSGSTGWNPQKVANKLIYYELPTSLITFLQSIKRVYRRRQPRRVRIWYLVTKGSAEHKLLQGLRDGREVADEIMSDKGDKWI